MTFRFGSSLALVLLFVAGALRAEDRTFNGTGNNIAQPAQGAANTPFIRFNYTPQYAAFPGTMFTEPARPNPRDISNAVFAQSVSHPSARNLSNYIWAWGQFLTHDTDLSTTSNGSAVNGSAPIDIHSPTDPLGPNSIPFTRANFVLTPLVFLPASGEVRSPVNEVTSYIDASAVYGSDAVRAAALRTNGGTGAKLLTDANNLLPRNTAGLPNENNGPVPGNQLFLAGDIRSNENSMLTALHTIFAREHNRLVDRIAAQQPQLNGEEQYQLARKLVGAEMQAITYHEFLPALLGTGTTVPKAEQYLYSPGLPATITTAHAFAAFRYGHSAVTSQLNLVANEGAPAGSLALRDVFFSPNLIGNSPGLVDELLQGAAAQRSEEIDSFIVDDLRNFLFGPPGAGGLDLASLNIQRARDVGLPTPGGLSRAYQFQFPSSFNQLTSDPTLAQALTTLYGTVNNVDTWVAGLAQDHVAGASVGDIFRGIISNQFRRLRDGDRLFYRSTAAGLYANNTLDPAIAAIVDLDNITLADIILANTSIDHLPTNVFFVPHAGDYNGDGLIDSADYITWRRAVGTDNIWADGDGNGTVGPEDFEIWRANFGLVPSQPIPPITPVPEPSTSFLLLLILLLPAAQSRARRPTILA
jgi:Animal haem peroxidase